MPNRIEELFAELAESAGGQQQFQMDQQLQQMEAQRQLHDTPEARRALEIAGILGLLALPIPGSNTLAARLGLGQAGKPLINKSYGAVGGDMVSQTLKAIEQGTIGRSGSGVGADVAGRYALPKAKPSVVTKQGPRGPINIGQPPAGPPRPAPPKGTRNTSGISDAERAQLPQTGGGITATKTARGDKEFLDKIMPSVRKDITEEASKTNIKGVRFSRKEWEDMLEETATTGKATKSYMDKVKSLKSLEDKLRIDQAKINAGEAPSKNFTKMLEEAARLRALLKSLE